MRLQLRSIPLALALFAGGVPDRIGAQSGPDARLVVTIAAGVVTGSHLWSLGRQPFCSKIGTPCASNEYDTLRLGRDLTSSLIAGASVTYFPSPYLGFQGEITYLGFPLRDACFVINAGASTPTNQLCANMQGQSNTTGAVSFFAGVIARATPRRAINPFVRAGLGLVTIDQSTVDMSGIDANLRPYAVLIDDSPKHLAASGVLAAGLTVPLGPGYQFRLEGRDVVSSLDRVAGPADASLRPPIESRLLHHFALTFGLDVVLEHKRGRRY